MSRRPCLPGLALALLAACGGQPDATHLQVGAHSIVVTVPDGWEHLDYGSTHQLRRGLSRITIADMDSLGDDVKWAARRALATLGEVERRDEASRREFQITGRDAIEIDTWDRMSHQYRKRFVFVNDQERYLAVYTQLGKFEAMETAFDSLVTSIAFTDSLPD